MKESQDFTREANRLAQHLTLRASSLLSWREKLAETGLGFKRTLDEMDAAAQIMREGAAFLRGAHTALDRIHGPIETEPSPKKDIQSSSAPERAVVPIERGPQRRYCCDSSILDGHKRGCSNSPTANLETREDDLTPRPAQLPKIDRAEEDSEQ